MSDDADRVGCLDVTCALGGHRGCDVHADDGLLNVYQPRPEGLNDGPGVACGPYRPAPASTADAEDVRACRAALSTAVADLDAYQVALLALLEELDRHDVAGLHGDVDRAVEQARELLAEDGRLR